MGRQHIPEVEVVFQYRRIGKYPRVLFLQLLGFQIGVLLLTLGDTSDFSQDHSLLGGEGKTS